MSGVRLDVRSNMDRVVAEFAAERDELLNKATYRALNRALDKSVTETSREIRKVYNVRDRAVKKAITKRRANSMSLFARMTIEGARLGLIEFDARWHPGQRGGASVKIKVGGGRKTVLGAFIATMRYQEWRSGADVSYRGVFRRLGKSRLPIRFLRSISIPQAFANKAVLDAVQRLAVIEFDKTLEQQVRYLRGVI
jgi:hypothetical protein